MKIETARPTALQESQLLPVTPARSFAETFAERVHASARPLGFSEAGLLQSKIFNSPSAQQNPEESAAAFMAGEHGREGGIALSSLDVTHIPPQSEGDPHIDEAHSIRPINISGPDAPRFERPSLDSSPARMPPTLNRAPDSGADTRGVSGAPHGRSAQWAKLTRRLKTFCPSITLCETAAGIEIIIGAQKLSREQTARLFRRCQSLCERFSLRLSEVYVNATPIAEQVNLLGGKHGHSAN